jgi:hypothetical protein
LGHLQQTLPKNLKDNERSNAVFIVLDYNDQDGLGDYIQREHSDDLNSGRLVYYHNKDEPKFRMAHAKNQAHRCGMLEGADILVTLDADNLTGRGFADYVSLKFESDPGLSFICPDFKSLPPPGKRFNARNPIRLGRGFAGRLAIRARDFVKIGGYDEDFETWRGEDIDMIARLDRLALAKGWIDSVYLNAIAHNAKIRFREYPGAERYEDEDMFALAEKCHNTVVNDGEFGLGQVYRNFSTTPITLEPLPTRIFGIGMQRTGTTSLHEAFKQLGFDSGHWESAMWAKSVWQEMNKWGRSRTLERHYALCDNPIPVLYDRLDKAYPGSKFILTVRPEEEWLESIEKFWTYEGNPRRWVWDEDGFSHRMHSITYGTPWFDRQTFLDRYRRHTYEVEEYFKGCDNFLRIDVNDRTTMADLCRFLDRPVIKQLFPHQNRGEQL